MKTKLSQAIAAIAVMGAATAASAAPTVNPDGLGQALLFPLYTVENNNQTTLHLTNTTENFKAVKVRFRRATDSADVLDFNLYLSPHDMWTGVVSMGENGTPVLTSHDTSCISADPNRTDMTAGREFGVLGDSTKGHVEVIEMANWTPDEAKGAAVSGTDINGDYWDNIDVATAVEHKKVGDERVPGNCHVINAAWETGNWLTAYRAAAEVDSDESFENTDLGYKPTGGLYGGAYIINVDQAWAASYEPTAMDIYDSETEGNNHHEPKYGLPDLQGEDVDVLKLVLATPEWKEDAAGDLSGAVAELESLVVLKNHGMEDADAIADELRATKLYTDFTLGSGIEANTELAVTFPMRYAGFPNPNSEIEFNVTFTDREEDRVVATTGNWQWSPWVPSEGQEGNFFFNETNLIKLTHEDGVDRNDLGEWNHEIETDFTTGWLQVDFAAEQLSVNLKELEDAYQAYLDGLNHNKSENRVEYAMRQLGLSFADLTNADYGDEDSTIAELLFEGTLGSDAASSTDVVYQQGANRFITLADGAQPVIGFSNIVLQNGLAVPGVNNIYSITHELKYERPGL